MIPDDFLPDGVEADDVCVFRFSIDGRGYYYERLFLGTAALISRYLIDDEVHLGEVAGKHSSVSVCLDWNDFAVVTTNPREALALENEFEEAPIPTKYCDNCDTEYNFPDGEIYEPNFSDCDECIGYRDEFGNILDPFDALEITQMKGYMPLVIVESPFAGESPSIVAENVKYAQLAMRDCLRRGEAPYASHLLYTQANVLDDNVPEERTLGIEAGLAWGLAAEKTVVYEDLGMTKGMLKGIQRAEAAGRPIEYRRLNAPDIDR